MEAPQPQSDSDIINADIEAAVAFNQRISGNTARLIASQLHDGMSSAYYAFASSGTVLPERLYDEIWHDMHNDDLGFEAQSWLAHLLLYLFDRPSVE